MRLLLRKVQRLSIHIHVCFNIILTVRITNYMNFVCFYGDYQHCMYLCYQTGEIGCAFWYKICFTFFWWNLSFWTKLSRYDFSSGKSLSRRLFYCIQLNSWPASVPRLLGHAPGYCLNFWLTWKKAWIRPCMQPSLAISNRVPNNILSMPDLSLKMIQMSR